MAARFALEMSSCSSSTSSFHGFSSRSQLLTVLGKRNSMLSIRASQSVPPPKENGAEKEEKSSASSSSSSSSSSAAAAAAAAPKTTLQASSTSSGAGSATSSSAASTAPAVKKEKKVSTNPMDVMAFSGPGPETINGRLAMVGFAAAMAVEAATGRGLAEQIEVGGGESWFVAAALLITAASLVPMLKGVTRESKASPGSLMSATAETWNGRAAMLGLVALALTEYLKQGPLI